MMTVTPVEGRCLDRDEEADLGWRSFFFAVAKSGAVELPKEI